MGRVVYVTSPGERACCDGDESAAHTCGICRLNPHTHDFGANLHGARARPSGQHSPTPLHSAVVEVARGSVACVARDVLRISRQMSGGRVPGAFQLPGERATRLL